MHRKKVELIASALLAVTIGALFFCQRNNPYDVGSNSFVPGKKPHVTFVKKTMSAFLFDTVSIPVVWSDTAIGGVKGAIKTFYIDWHGDTLFNDSVAGTNADTLVLRRAFPAGAVTIRIKALDYDGYYSEPDSMKLSVLLSKPTIVSTSGSRTILRTSVCTLSVSATDTGGVIQTFFWAANGTDFADSTSTGSFQVSYADTGAKLVLVKARDNKGIGSGVDTFHLAVYDKRGAVLYDGNGNTGGSAPTDTNTYVSGQTVVVLGNTGNLVKSGYVFSGWNTRSNGSGANYSAGAAFSMDTTSAVLYAQWTANPTFSVSYNGNGNTGGTTPSDTASYSIGQSVTVLGNTGSLVKTGNTFVGWNTQANGNGIGYAAGVSFVMGSGSVTLYAQWTADPTYAVTYNGNANTGGAVPVDGNNYLSGSTVTVLGNPGGLVKTGNTFIGWNTQANGGGTAYASRVTFTMGSANVTLYAQWTALPTYTVTYNGNGNTAGTAPVDSNSYMQGQTVTTRSMGSLAKTGYSFTGWNTQTTGAGIGYAAGATFAMGTANVTLYAQWTLIPTYAVTYDGNGNTAGAAPADNNHYTVGQSVTVLGNTGNLSKTSYTFVGWNTQANGIGIGYAAGVSFVIGSGNVTLYAQWTADPTYAVTYNGNTNTGGTPPVDANNYLSGSTVAVLGNTGGLVKTGNTFIGWNTQANGGGTAYASGVTFAMGSANVTLYAQWTALPTYTVTYSGNGSTAGTAPADANSYLQGQTVTTRGMGTLVKPGYSFSGWNTQANGTGISYAAGVTFAIGTANVTLFAQWTLIPTYGVAYNGNGNTTGAAPADNNRYTAGQPVTVLENTGNLSKTGYTFVGWNTQANGNGIGYATGVSFVMGSANVTLYAQWTANPTYTVTYNGNTNTSGTVPVDGNNYLSGVNVTVLGNTGGLVKTGNTFIGWNTQADGGGTAYASGVTFAMGSGNVTLYAQWTALPTYTVTYTGNGSTGGIAPVDANSYMSGQTVTTLNIGTLVKTGATFTGWNTKPDGSGTGYAAGATFAMGGANVTLYAQWTLIPTYTVAYDGNGNTTGAAPADNNQYVVGQSVIVLGNTGNLIKTSYTFVGWNTQANGSGISYAAGVSFVMGSAIVTLYAQWTANPTYTVTYSGNTNTGGTPPVDGNNYLSGAAVTVLGNTGGLVKTGNTLIGWNTQANGGGTAYASGATFAMGAANVTLYAQWTALPTYTVTYSGNGSTGGTAPVDANSYLQGQTVTTLNIVTLVKTGSTFTGWNTKADGSGTGYAAGVTFAMGVANVTLFAQWTPIPTYTVVYNGNGNTSGTSPADNNHYTVGQSVIVLGNTGNLVKTSFTFVGWNTASNGSGIGYAAGVSFVMGSGNVTLYAQWTANPTYTVTYSGNTNTGGTPPADGNNYLSGATVTVLGNTGGLVKTGNTFIGWNTQANGGGTPYASGVTFAIGSANVTLYAQWTALPTYTVTYSGNGSTGGIAPVDANSYIQGQTVTTLNVGTLVKAGSTFSGWNTQANGTGISYAAGVTFAMGTSNVTLFAQWTLIPTYTVVYNGNGNTSGAAPADNSQYTVGQSVIVLGNTGNLVKTSFTFVGWNTASNGSGIGYAAGVSFVMGSGNVTLYAQWTANPTYTVAYSGNTNTGGTPPLDGNNYLSGATVTVLGNTGGLVKTGNTFIGWNTQANGGGTAYASGNTFAMGSANVTLYAQWTALPTYTVTYSGNGSTGGIPPSDPNSYLQGQTVTTLNVGTLVKAGSTFSGWNTQANGTGISYAAGVTFAMGTSNVTLFAQWTLIQTYAVVYSGNGNTSGTAPADNNQYSAGQNVTVLGNTGNLSKTGYTFVGWNTQAAGGGIGYTGGVLFVMGSGNVTLYAQWTANPTYTVTYNGNTNTSGIVPVDGNNYLSGATVTVLGNTGGLVKTGFSLAGWSTNAGGGGTVYAPGATFAMGSSNVTLYAQWNALPTYTVTYNGNTNTSGNVPVDGNAYLPGATVTVRNVGTLLKTGCAFAGWNTSADGSGNPYSPGDTFVMGAANVTLYAHWTVTITASADSNGAILPAGSVSVPYNGSQAFTITPNAGYQIATITVDGSPVGSPQSPYLFTSVTAAHTITASFAIDTFTVTYNGNGNTGGNVPTDPNKYTYGQNVTVLDNTGSLVNTGFNFVGWNTQADGLGTTYLATQTIVSISSNITLYALWQ